LFPHAIDRCRVPDEVRGQIVDLALEYPELSPREPPARFTDTRGYFVSEASVYRSLHGNDLTGESMGQVLSVCRSPWIAVFRRRQIDFVTYGFRDHIRQHLPILQASTVTKLL